MGWKERKTEKLVTEATDMEPPVVNLANGFVSLSLPFAQPILPQRPETTDETGRFDDESL